MPSRKTSGVKIRLLKQVKQNFSVPTWVIVRTKRRVRTHPKKRNWRKSKLKVK